MMSEVCTNCQCYITPPNPWHGTVPPKMFQCSSWKRDKDEELLRKFQERAEKDWARIHEAFVEQKTFHEEQMKLLQFIKENMPKRRDGRLGPL